MSKRRMFSMNIVDTDAFLEAPQSSQLLYFHFSMRADDDGFISNPKKIMKVIGSTEDDYKILVAKKFIIPFESGVCVIKHWLIHNLIRHDRYTCTQYVKEKESLMVDLKTRKYSLIKGDNNVIPDGYQRLTQVRLGKVRLDKNIHQKQVTNYKNENTRKEQEHIDSEKRKNPEFKKMLIKTRKLVNKYKMPTI